MALSFAGEDRAHAEGLAERLRGRGIKVFYDRYERATLWGKDLYVHLHDIYSKRARFCVLFVSDSYAKKLWTSHEHKAAQERAFKDHDSEYILPIRVDDTEVPGLPAIVGYLQIGEGIDEIALLLIEKLGRR
ncbi:MAG: TIR domain-containing protein [Polyangiales bacterium]